MDMNEVERLEAKRASARKYARENKEKIAAYKKEWRKKKLKENPNYWKEEYKKYEGQIKIYGKKYKSIPENKRRLSLIKRKYHAENKDLINKKIRVARKKRALKNPNYWKKISSKDPIKIRARSIANNYPLKESCEFCSSTERLERHHHKGYEKPEIFQTLCRDCHSKEDRKYK